MAINQDFWDSMLLLVSNDGSRSLYFLLPCFIGLNTIYRISSVKDVNLRISNPLVYLTWKFHILFLDRKSLNVYMKNHFAKIIIIVTHPVLTCSYDKGRKILFNILINIEITIDCQTLKIRYIMKFYQIWGRFLPYDFFDFFNFFIVFWILRFIWHLKPKTNNNIKAVLHSLLLWSIIS